MNKSLFINLLLSPFLLYACPNSENPIGAGNISSPNYPQPYDNNANCTYLLVADQMNSTNTTISYSIVMLQIVDFSTEPSYDYIMIYDGPSINSRAIFTMNGQNMGSRSINSTQRYMTVQFVTDATIAYRGFFATYTSAMGSVPVGCPNGSVYPVGYGDVTSPMFPLEYGNNEDCIYHVSAETGRTLVIQMQFFQTERNHDFLYLYDGQTTTSPIIDVLTGHYAFPSGYFTTGQFLTLRFVSDAAVVYGGFRLSYQNSYLDTTPTIPKAAAVVANKL